MNRTIAAAAFFAGLAIATPMAFAQTNVDPAAELAVHRANLVELGQKLDSQRDEICSRQKERRVCEHNFLSTAVKAALALSSFDAMGRAADALDLIGLAREEHRWHEYNGSLISGLEKLRQYTFLP